MRYIEKYNIIGMANNFKIKFKFIYKFLKGY